MRGDTPYGLKSARGAALTCVLCVGPQVVHIDLRQPADEQLQLVVGEDAAAGGRAGQRVSGSVWGGLDGWLVVMVYMGQGVRRGQGALRMLTACDANLGQGRGGAVLHAGGAVQGVRGAVRPPT